MTKEKGSGILSGSPSLSTVSGGVCEKAGVGIAVMKLFSGGQLLDARTSPFQRALTENQCIQYHEVLGALPGYGHRVVVTLEDGVIDGGFGEKVARFYGTSSMKVLNFGAKKEFVNHVAVEEQYLRYHLTPEQIVSDILKEIKD